MVKIDLSNEIAAEMDKIMRSEEHNKLFSSAAMMEKLAFKKVSEQDEKTEVEIELEKTLTKTASDNNTSEDLVSKSVNNLLKISEELDSAGFEKFAAASILLADKLVSEAKAKAKAKSKSDSKEKSSKSESKSSKESDKSKSKDKKKSKKVDMKERMKKMREMKDKKSGKKVSKAQEYKNETADLFKKLNLALPPFVKDNIKWITFEVKKDNADELAVYAQFKVKPEKAAHLNAAIKATNAPSLSNYIASVVKEVEPRVKITNIVEAL